MADLKAFTDAVMALYVIDWCPNNKSDGPVAVLDIMQGVDKVIGKFMPVRMHDVSTALNFSNKFNMGADADGNLFVRPKKMHDHVSYYLLNSSNVGDEMYDVCAAAMNNVLDSVKKPYKHIDGQICIPDDYMFRLKDGSVFKWGPMELATPEEPCAL